MLTTTPPLHCALAFFNPPYVFLHPVGRIISEFFLHGPSTRISAGGVLGAGAEVFALATFDDGLPGSSIANGG